MGHLRPQTATLDVEYSHRRGATELCGVHHLLTKDSKAWMQYSRSSSSSTLQNLTTRGMIFSRYSPADRQVNGQTHTRQQPAGCPRLRLASPMRCPACRLMAAVHWMYVRVVDMLSFLPSSVSRCSIRSMKTRLPQDMTRWPRAMMVLWEMDGTVSRRHNKTSNTKQTNG